jgi:hypothetical protein
VMVTFRNFSSGTGNAYIVLNMTSGYIITGYKSQNSSLTIGNSSTSNTYTLVSSNGYWLCAYGY